MIENQKFRKINDIKSSVTNSQNALMSENDIIKNEDKKVHESIKERNKDIKRRIAIMSEKDELNIASKGSNENILLLNKNNNKLDLYNDEYIDKFGTYFNSKNLNINKLSTEEIYNEETINENENEDEDENEINKNKDNDINSEKEKEEIDINDIFNLITGYDIYKKIEINIIKLFFFNSLPDGKTLNTNINKIKKNENNELNFNYNLEIIRNNQIFFYAKIKKTFPSINIRIFIKTSNNQYIKVGKIISNVLKNNFILYKEDNKTNYKKVLTINYDLNFFGIKVRNMTVEKIINNEIKYILCNDSPEWDYEYKTYKLNFNGRVKKSCKKNFILKYKNTNTNTNIDGEKNKYDNENINDERLLQCGKIDDYSFALDFISPLSPFEAFSISISSIINKISCE